MKEIKINLKNDSLLDLCLNTIDLNKQVLVFCSSKKSAESVAEKISKIISKVGSSEHIKLANQIENILQSPTKQCKKLSSCVEKGIAFHHAGLTSKQRELIEDNFRTGTIKVICSTPTLAAGIDLPAFRAIIKDMKRFNSRGMMPIQVLEYLQMAGRAGRPGKEDYGEAIILGKEIEDVKYYFKNYVNGKVEEIYSKLAVEPVLRMYVLSLISSEKIRTLKDLYAFFDSTFYAFQFGDIEVLHSKLNLMIEKLKNWKMLEGKVNSDFVTADKFEKSKEDLTATLLGKRISEIYIDPLTAIILIKNFNKIKNFEHIVHLLSCCLEIRPLIKVKASEYDAIIEESLKHELILDEEEFNKISTENYEDTLKTTFFLLDWANEKSEDYLMEKYNVRPGEITAKLQIVDWLLFACSELARIEKQHNLINLFNKARIQLKEGVKEELLPLLQFKGIGRIRARKLFDFGIKNISDVTAIEIEKLVELIGVKLAISLKEQVGIKIELNPEEPIKSSQISLDEFIKY